MTSFFILGLHLLFLYLLREKFERSSITGWRENFEDVHLNK